VRELLRWNAGTLRYVAARLMRDGVLDGAVVERLVRGKHIEK
jgi:hypothetical protein